MALDLEVPTEAVEETPRTSMTSIGRWELGQTLGRGAYAHVRLATHDTGYISACKILPSLHGPIPRKFSRDQRIDAVEAHKELVMLKGLAGANIPGIVGLEGVISCQGWNFIFLSVYPHSAATVTKYPLHVIPFFRRLLISVYGLHALDISHEDIKRSNVLATEYFEPILVDFGFAHFTPSGGHVRSLGGTVDYSSPEKLSDKYYDPFRSDIWSLGILLLKMLGMRNPYRIKSGETEDEFKEKLFNTSPDWNFLGNHSRPGRIGEVIRGMLERDPMKRWSIESILDHPSMQTSIPDPDPMYIPSYDLPDDIRLTEDIVLDVAFLAYNLQEFQLCESLATVVETLVSGGPNWRKQWAGLLGRWMQREETMWEDVSVETAVNTPRAKAARGSRLSGVDVAKLSRGSLRPLREIHVQRKADNIPAEIIRLPGPTRPAGPLTPRRKGAKKVPIEGPPKIPRKSVELAAHSPTTPIKTAALGQDANGAPQTPPRRTRQGEARVFKAAAPKVIARAPVPRLRRKVKPMADDVQIPQQSADVPQLPMIVTSQDLDPIELSSEPINPAPSSQATLAPTRRATHAGTTGAPKKATKDKENIPPPGERPTTGLRPPLRGAINPLQPTRRSPRFA